MKIAEAPAGVKFALGENVKRSNFVRPDVPQRYPISRMGVVELIRDSLQAAQQYDARWAAWNTSRNGAPPRRDLELEALAEILRGERWIHCHSYRQDEILALLKLLDEYDVTIGSLQHILEGYKVADAMARHGATGSAFADWWAYKFEVYDAIPYNGALMHRAGVIVSYNSDDRELARHLNHEAAKAVKYGGVSPEQALQFVTLNPAKQLRIDQHVGSLEPGKHADLVVWSGVPYPRCRAANKPGWTAYFASTWKKTPHTESRIGNKRRNWWKPSFAPATRCGNPAKGAGTNRLSGRVMTSTATMVTTTTTNRQSAPS